MIFESEERPTDALQYPFKILIFCSFFNYQTKNDDIHI